MKKIKIQWNDLTWETQLQVLDKIEELLLKQTDPAMQEAMVAAMTELEIWSNTPCNFSGNFEGSDDDKPYVAYAFAPTFDWESK